MQRHRNTRLQKAKAAALSVGSDPNGPAVGTSRIGAELRAARQRLGWALPDIAAQLRIRQAFLQAIEDGRPADLPGNTYAIGYLRSYAATLGLDAAEIARRFRAETQEVSHRPELAFPAPVPDRSVPMGAVVLLGALVMLGTYAGWYRFSSAARSPAEAVSVMPDRLAAFADRVTPPSSPSPPAASSLPDPSVPEAAVSSPPPSAILADPAPLVAFAQPEVPVTGDGRIVLRLKSDSWLQVRERQGHVLLNRVMREGESWPVPKAGQLLLTTGNAGGTELLVDGQAVPSLGPAGAVRRDVPLDPDALKAAH